MAKRLRSKASGVVRESLEIHDVDVRVSTVDAVAHRGTDHSFLSLQIRVEVVLVSARNERAAILTSASAFTEVISVALVEGLQVPATETTAKSSRAVSNHANIFDEFTINLKVHFLRQEVRKLGFHVQVVIRLKVLSSFKSPEGSHLALTSLHSLLLDVHVDLRDFLILQSLSGRYRVTQDRSARRERGQLTTHRGRRRAVCVIDNVRHIKASRSLREEKRLNARLTRNTKGATRTRRTNRTNLFVREVTRGDVELGVHHLLARTNGTRVTHVEDLRDRAVHGLGSTDLVEHKLRVGAADQREGELLESANLTRGGSTRA